MFMLRARCVALCLFPMSLVPPATLLEQNNEQATLLLIKQHIANGPGSLTLDQLSQALGISKKQISSMFRRQLGVTVMQFLRDERMRRAQRLLLQTSMDIGEIAISLGYSGNANFSNAFRDYVGMSPRDFREKAPLDAITTSQGAMHWDSSEY